MSGKRRAEGPPVTKAPKPPKPKRSWKRRLLSVVKWGLVAGLVLALVGVGSLVYLYQVTELPDPNEDFETQTSFVYYADGSSQIGQFATQDRTSISYDEMPQNMKDAVVAAENQTFWTDSGIDFKGILRAVVNNAAGNDTQGASTITQQYIKIMYLTQEQSYSRKLKEALLALKLQRQVSKSELLANYLNTIYFGRGAYGVQAAAQAFFAKDAADLTLRESAVLASVINNPTRFDPANGKENRQALIGRYEYTLNSMAKLGSITQQQADQAKKRLPAFPKIEGESTYGGQRGHMLTLVKKELLQLGYTEDQIDGGGLRVTTTLTQKAMRAAERGVREAKPEGMKKNKKLHVAVASVEPGTGALRGFYGGQDYLESQINWATAGGMVGSTMKPITLATALSQGFSLKDTFDGNSPFEFPDGLEVRNEGTGYDGLGNDYGSAINAIYALEQSVNTAFVDMSAAMDNGPQKIYRMAEKMGIPPNEADQRYPGMPSTSRDFNSDDTLLTLGKARISAINMANAYATIANGGVRANVHVVQKVELADGSVDYRYDADDTTRAMSADVAADTAYAMQQVVNNGTGRTALALGRPVGGKTGTATNDKDQVSSAWFVGMTPNMATAVMYVRGDGDDQLDGWLPSYFGSAYPASTWEAVMERLMEGVEVEDFPEPAYVDGDAPDGHEPTTSAPTPTETESASESPSASPSESASETPTPSQTPSATASETPTSSPSPTDPTASDSCGLVLCPSDGSSPSQTTQPSGSASAAGQQGRTTAERRRRQRRRSGRRRTGGRAGAAA
ncbi:transglycosylase domain-containing protein [Nocardioides bruguierae]|uniref:transglycosylase domain-containing protein n=1 Tax=Nocardioides bruguierae TaxID=2945102 RepID=UPI0020216AE1|nr:transglycosylase domain-containing protein [Nocardioides bruguierae]MCL8026694.1 penicillin-binding protein [Nocardioides bruguierae]